MPSNRQIATNKRKASEDDHDEAGSTSNVKKVKPPPKSIKSGGASTTREGFAENGQPTNKTIPTEIHFPEKNADSVRIASWNVSGLAASLKKVRRSRSQTLGIEKSPPWAIWLNRSF